MIDILLNIPMMPPDNVTPNKQRNSWKQRAPLVKENKIQFSKVLEDIFPLHTRPSKPIEKAYYGLLFKIPNTNIDWVNICGRIKPWEDILVKEKILANDSFKVVQQVRINYLVCPEDVGVLWNIMDEACYTHWQEILKGGLLTSD